MESRLELLVEPGPHPRTPSTLRPYLVNPTWHSQRTKQEDAPCCQRAFNEEQDGSWAQLAALGTVGGLLPEPGLEIKSRSSCRLSQP